MKTLRGFILLSALTLIALSGCSLINSSPFSPPDWTIGSWTDDYDILSWEFTADNVLYHSDNFDMDYKVLSKEPDTEITIDESSDTDYGFTYISNSVETKYSFEFVDDTTINYTIGDLTPVVLHKD